MMTRLIWHTLRLLLTVLLVGRDVVHAIPKDEHENCEMWASNGECENNPEYMMHHCARSCALEKAHREVAEEQLKGIESFFDLSAPDIDGNEIKFEEFRGKVTILTNVASYCGYTDQHYRELVELWGHLQNESVEILAFPCNQFGKQEPGTAEEIKHFAHSKGVKFRMMKKINVNGPQASLVYKYLKREAGVGNITWNFATYFVVSPDGQVSAYTGTSPMSLKTVALGLLGGEEL